MTYNNNTKSLTILINTRIHGYLKIKYLPSMSVPGTRSDTIYLNTTIQLNEKVASDSKPEQFFSRTEFDSLLNRSIQSLYLGQSKNDTTVRESTIKKNIEITLKRLFHSGDLFYLKGQPFRIYNYEWKGHDWQWGTKQLETDFKSGRDVHLNKDTLPTRRERQQRPSKLSYYVIVDLELHPGKDELSTTKKVSLGCDENYEKIRKSWADMFGNVYTPTEITVKKKEDTNKKGTKETDKIKTKTRRYNNDRQYNNVTRRPYDDRYYNTRNIKKYE